MKNVERIARYFPLTLLLAALPVAAFAAGHGPGFGPGKGHGPHGGFGAGHMAEHLAERLDLSQAQRDQIRTIHEGYREQADLLMETVKTARQDLGDRIHAELFDEAAIREAAGRLAAAEADLAVLRARIVSDLRQVLTPEQAAEARELHEWMREFAGSHRGHPRGGRGGFSGPPVDGE